MRLAERIRARDWFEHKLPMHMAVAYACIAVAPLGPPAAFSALALVGASIAIGAVYVSLINDYTDQESDRRANKPNSFRGVRPAAALAMVFAPVLAGVAFALWWVPHPPVLWSYVGAWLAFTLYSVPPFRLKERGAWGVLADAMGAHLFPALYAVLAIHAIADKVAQTHLLVAVSLWALMFGLRGILWHQMTDRAHDAAAGSTTFGVHPMAEALVGRIAWPILGTELLAFAWLAFAWNVAVLAPLLLGYGLMVFARWRRYGLRPSVIAPRNGQFLMSEFYGIVLPLTLLVACVLQNPGLWPLLVGHVLVFARMISVFVGDCARLLVSRRIAARLGLG